MNHSFAPLRNTSLPRNFRQVRLERARDHEHPEGDRRIAYVLIAPLDADSRIDVASWRHHKEACRVVRERPDGEDNLGHLVHGPGGSWRFHYDVTADLTDEAGYHFGDEKLEPGEYLSIRGSDGEHSYRVVSVQPL